MVDKLKIVETKEAIFVTFNGNLDEWVARFELEEVSKFPSRLWAERMVSLYNQNVNDDESTKSNRN